MHGTSVIPDTGSVISMSVTAVPRYNHSTHFCLTQKFQGTHGLPAWTDQCIQVWQTDVGEKISMCKSAYAADTKANKI